jgi:hypothetical protein
MCSPGYFSADLQPKDASRNGILDFVARQLPAWRDDEARPPESSEDGLSDQLCKFLNRASRKSPGFNRYFFNREARDAVRKDRNLDIEVSPAEDHILVEGRVHTLYDTVLAIECKRLPTPSSKGRDDREYVITIDKTTGGIQRFRRGDHGSNLPVVGMIGYVQEGRCPDWLECINNWITSLAEESGELTWSSKDLLAEREDCSGEPYRARSTHSRLRELDEVAIEHIWIQMNQPQEGGE